MKQHNSPVGRVYSVNGTELVFPSITRLLGAKPKPGLEAWRRRVGPAEAARVSTRATNRGGTVHKLAECFLGNLDLPSYQPNVAELWQTLRPWLRQHVHVVYAQEQDVYSSRLKVAGRMDLLANVDFELAVVDIKTAERPKKDEYVHDYFLQGTFYACAVYELTGLKVKRIVLPVVYPGGLQLFECPAMKHFDELRSRINEYYRLYAPADINTLTA